MLIALATPCITPAAAAWRIARAAVRSLHTELTLAPKPGLVCPGDNGSHRDMTAATLFRSLFSLRHYFRAIAAAGYRGASFPELQRLGLAAEARMLAATDSVNTHRGAIFNLGLIAAAAARLIHDNHQVTAASLACTVRERWGTSIRETLPNVPSHGLLVAARYGAGGARLEAARGFPSVFGLALPALRDGLRRGLGRRRALIDTMFLLIARLEDTNLLYRGGPEGLKFAQQAAADFLARGGAAAPDWERHASTIRDAFVRRRLSPGGTADLLAVTCFVHSLTAA